MIKGSRKVRFINTDSGLIRPQNIIKSLINPVRNENIGLPRAAIVAVAGENDLLSVRAEHGEGIKTAVAAHFFQPASVRVHCIHIERKAAAVLVVAAEDDP